MNRDKLKEKYGKEEVLITKFEDMPELEEGFNKMRKDDPKINKIIENSHFQKRYKTEHNHEKIELIPYTIVTDLMGEKIFCYKRLKGGGEDRLHEKLSIGVGGHINPFQNKRGSKLIDLSLKRELVEELIIIPDALFNAYNSFMGVIRLTKTPVDSDHLALLNQVAINEEYCNKDYISVREQDTLEGEFVTVDYLKNNYEKLENWSQIVVNNL